MVERARALRGAGLTVMEITEILGGPGKTSVWRWIRDVRKPAGRAGGGMDLPRLVGDGPDYPDIDPEDKDALIERLRLANSTLSDACSRLAPGERPVIHSDRGVHYRWPGWISICERNGLVRSMSAKGCSPDNAAMEGFFGLLKKEFFHGRDWSGWSPGEFIEALGAWIGRFNSERASDALGGATPDDYRSSLGMAAI